MYIRVRENNKDCIKGKEVDKKEKKGKNETIAQGVSLAIYQHVSHIGD